MPIAPVRRTVTSTTNSSSSIELRVGAKGAGVVSLQRQLTAAGFPAGADGEFGTRTQQALMRFQRSKGLRVDGVAGPDTFRALRTASNANSTPTPVSGPTTSSGLRNRILDTARGELGTRESGNNRGAIQKYQHFFGRGAEKWCADFVSYVSTQSGKPLNFASTQALEAHFKQTGTWKGRSNPQPGDIVIFDFNHDGRADHTGFVERVNPDGSLTTLEGNTSNPNGPGQGVFRKHRTTGTVLGYGTP
ncbi:MAG: peptidoglycan-binding protein [Myxococcaceae bacterium]